MRWNHTILLIAVIPVCLHNENLDLHMCAELCVAVQPYRILPQHCRTDECNDLHLAVDLSPPLPVDDGSLESKGSL